MTPIERNPSLKCDTNTIRKKKYGEKETSPCMRKIYS